MFPNNQLKSFRSLPVNEVAVFQPLEQGTSAENSGWLMVFSSKSVEGTHNHFVHDSDFGWWDQSHTTHVLYLTTLTSTVILSSEIYYQ